MKIPRKIHYCWFGGNPLSKLTVECINSWKRYCPDYEIIEWNEKNFDINSNLYVKQAYEAKKWAFVSDYVRLKVVYDYGGIYMDTDVEVVKNLDEFLNCEAFSGFESKNAIPTGIIGANKHHPWIEFLLSYYNNAKFIKEDGSFDTTTNVKIISNMTQNKYGVILNNTKQILKDNIYIYPFDYFCAKNQITGKIEKNQNTYTIHHFSGSWLSEWDKSKVKIKIGLSFLFGDNFVQKLIDLKNKL